jgi:hypothetical protein
MDKWTPPAAGKGFELTEILQPLAPFRERLNIISDLSHPQAYGGGSATSNHNRSAATFLSGAHAEAGPQAHLGITMDQFAARKIGQDTPLPSLELMIEDATLSCGDGLSCAYRDTISWQGPTSPLPMQNNPQVVFERLFGDGSSAQERIARKQKRASLLDAVTHEVARLNDSLPGTDRTRLNEYLEDIREIERRLKNVAKASDPSPEAQVPFGMPESFEEHIKLMWDLQALAFQADITRVSTLMYAHDVSMRSYPESGVATANHAASHHGGVPKRLEDWAKINRFHVQCLPYFLNKLKSAPDGDGTLLDHTLILWASNMGDSNLHSHKNVGHMLVGGAMGQHKGGRHIKTEGSTANILLTTLHMFGIEKQTIGDSTGAVSL